MYFVYILQCRDGSYYVGQTENVPDRVAIHNSGLGPAYTAQRLPVDLVFEERHATLERAVRGEKQLKRWSRAKKESLISGNMAELSKLAGCRQVKQKRSEVR